MVNGQSRRTDRQTAVGVGAVYLQGLLACPWNFCCPTAKKGREEEGNNGPGMGRVCFPTLPQQIKVATSLRIFLKHYNSIQMFFFYVS